MVLNFWVPSQTYSVCFGLLPNSRAKGGDYMFFEALNYSLESMFKEWSKSKTVTSRNHLRKYQELEHTPLLFSSDYLLELSENATNKAEQNMVLDYLYRFHNHEIGENEHLNILETDSYRNVEQFIIDKRWKP